MGISLSFISGLMIGIELVGDENPIADWGVIFDIFIIRLVFFKLRTQE